MGTAAVQLARTAEFGASFVAATSTDTALLASLGVDRPIDYAREEWWSLPEFMAGGDGEGEGGLPFDVIIDCAEGVTAWQRVSNGGGVLRCKGRS